MPTNISAKKTVIPTQKAGVSNLWENPGRAICRDGKIINTEGERWVLFDETVDTEINWELVKASPAIKSAMQDYVFYKIEQQTAQAASTVFICLKYFSQLIEHLNTPADITFTDLQNYLNQTRPDKYEWRFGHIRRWYEWCSRRDIPGFDRKILSRLKKLKVGTISVGQSVLNRDPDKGPLNDDEFRLVRQAVKEERGSLVSRVCVMLLLELGSRPAQLILLDETDFCIAENPNKKGEKFYSLKVRRTKQRVIGDSEKRTRRISTELGKQISLLIEENYRLYGKENKKPRPLLYSWTSKSPEIENPLEELLSSQRARRMTRPMMRYHVKNYPVNTKLISPRTGKIINLYPYRLRYTFATRHANQGTPAAALADMLDHKGLESVQVYTAGTSNMVNSLNEALGKNEHYSATIDRFLGKIQPKTENDIKKGVIHGTTPTLKNLGGIGVCGSNYLCNLFPPLSCYICPKFIAWKDAPHGAMLSELENYVQNIAETSGNPHDRIPHQLKETILAVKSLLVKLERDAEEMNK